MHDIAKLTGRGYATIHYWMHKHGVAMREREEASRAITRRYPIRSFSGTLEEKAYLFGIALGDLHARKVHKSIEIYTSTSVPSMVDLVVDAFSRYGRFRVRSTIYEVRGKKIGGWRVRAYLDLSFAFLLEKYTARRPAWILSSHSTFMAFLAGLFDAEGHSGIYDSKDHKGGSTTELTITNTNSKLIVWLRTQMKALGFHPRISSESSNDCVWYALILGRRVEIQRILRMMPFRHPKKKAVARILLGIPTRMNSIQKSAIINEFKLLRKAMKDDDRREGSAAVFEFENRNSAKMLMPVQPSMAPGSM